MEVSVIELMMNSCLGPIIRVLFHLALGLFVLGLMDAGLWKFTKVKISPGDYLIGILILFLINEYSDEFIAFLRVVGPLSSYLLLW